MASKIQGRTMYLAINPYRMDGVEDEFNELSVRVSYDDIHKNFYVAVHAGWKSDFGHGCILMGDSNPLTAPTYIKVKDSPRNSQKFIDDTALALEMAKEGIRLFFDKRDWRMLKWLVESVATVGYTYTIEQKVKERMTKENENENENQKPSETMAKESAKTHEYVGKVLVLGGGAAKYVIKGVNEEGTMFKAQYVNGAMTKDDVTLPLTQIETILKNGVGHFEGTADAEASATETKTATATADEVEEVEDIKVEAPKPKKGDKPKAKSEEREKTSDVSPQPSALKYSTYTNKKGKTCAKIVGFGENDAAYVNAADLHGSATYERDKDGEKTFYLIFGPRYVAAAKEVCDALNAGKSFADCKAIVDAATEERAQKREEWKQKRGKTYTEAEVADLLKRVIAGDAEAMRIVNELSKAA